MMKEIIELREKLEMSQAELARVMGVCPASVCRWENGERKPSLRLVRKLAAVLQVPLHRMVSFFE